MKADMRKPWVLAVLGCMGGGLVALLIAGCATIMHGSNQSISIASTPPSAKVFVDKAPAGQTPLVSKLSRKSSHIVRLELEGYQPYEATLSKGVSGWVWGNLVFGGPIGLVVDVATGGLYKLTPGQIQAEMKKEGASFMLEKDQLLLAVVLEPDPAWQRIDTLKPAARP